MEYIKKKLQIIAYSKYLPKLLVEKYGIIEEK